MNFKKIYESASKESETFRPHGDSEEEGYATWHSKNGDRKVTVLSIDEPNQRAKINTDKGATMYVPLSTLSKYADYGKYF